MYKHYETSDDVFVDREEYIEWMDDALVRCKQKSVVLHLKGIGGIGKSSLLKHWIKTKDRTVRVDCEQYSEFYDRLNVLAKGAVLQGVNLQRFDVLWQIRQRFVEGVEPVKEEGREWAKEVVMAIPFIGSLASIGSALSAVGTKVTPKLKGKYGTVGKWLQERLGKNHIERLLEILWKEPRHAEFLYIDALLEDINRRKDIDSPILFLMDHFEYVDGENAQWRYQGKKITQTELWSIFLSSLNNCVGVMTGRKPAVKREDLDLEETELTELDRDSCIEMLELQGVSDKELQEKIVSVSAGNPFVVDAICDMKDEGTIALDDVECLRADTLDEVRLKTWRRLFNLARDLQDIVNRAGLLQFFDRDLLNIVAPSLTSDIWDRLLRLSFVREREDGTWVLHDLASELILAELGPRVKSLTDEIAKLLKERADDEGDLTLIGHAFSVSALSSEEDAIEKAKDRINDLIRKEDKAHEALQILENMKFHSVKGQTEIQGLKGKALWRVQRFPEAEEAIREAIRINEELAKKEPEKHLDSVAEYICELYEILEYTRVDEAYDAISRALEIQRTVAVQGTPKQLRSLAWILQNYSWSLNRKNPLDGIPPAREAIAIYRKLKDAIQIPFSLNSLAVILQYANKWAESEEVKREAVELQRKLIESEPDNYRHKSVLAAMMNNLAFSADHKGDTKDAERFFSEAMRIRRSLADRNPDVFLQRLEHQLENNGFFYIKIHKLDEAEKLFLEELEIGQEKVEESLEEYQGWVEGGCIGLSLIYGARGKISQAISSIDQAISIRRKRIELGANVLTLGIELNISAVMCMRIGEYKKAEEAILEAIQLLREYGSLPPVWLGYLAMFLNNHGILLWRKGRLPEAKAALEEALEISRKKVPEYYNGLATLCNLAVILADNDELKAAEPHFQSALSIVEDLAQRTPEQYKFYHAIVLHNFSYYLSKAGRQTEAYSQLKKAIELKRGLIKEYPAIFEDSLTKSLSNLAVMLREENSPDAGDVFLEVSEMRKRILHTNSKEMPEEEKWQLEWEEKFVTFEE